MESRIVLVRAATCVAFASLLAAASLPSAMSGPGEWEVSKSASGSGGEKVCLQDPALLMQWEHRTRQCTRVIVTSETDKAVVQYTCVGSGFGTSKVEQLTPRTVRIDTQGIADGYPFAYVLHARRVGNCPAR
jgi:hypothetical protein